MKKTVFQELKDKVSGKEKDKKGHGFMDGIKDWITSPGGLITIGLFIITLAYIHHKTADEK